MPKTEDVEIGRNFLWIPKPLIFLNTIRSLLALVQMYRLALLRRKKRLLTKRLIRTCPKTNLSKTPYNISLNNSYMLLVRTC